MKRKPKKKPSAAKLIAAALDVAAAWDKAHSDCFTGRKEKPLNLDRVHRLIDERLFTEAMVYMGKWPTDPRALSKSKKGS